MNIIVLVKQVPNTTNMKVDPLHGTLIRSGVDTIINPDDLASIELALQVKDNIQDTHIRVITMGPAQAKNMLVDLYGYGVDDCVLLSDSAFAGADTWATSYTLAKAIERYPYDLIIAGRQAIDGDTAQVGPQVAQHCNIPQITYVSKLQEITKQNITVVKSYEDYDELLSCNFPCLITALSDKTTLRDASFTMVWHADKKNITTLTNKEIQGDPHNIGLKGSLTQVKKTFVKTVEKKGQMISNDVDLAAKKIAQILKDATH